MQLDSDGPTTSSRLGTRETGEQIRTLTSGIREVERLHAEGEKLYQRALRSEDGTLTRGRERLEVELERKIEATCADRHELQRRLENFREIRRERLLRVTGDLRRRLKGELEAVRRRSEEDQDRLKANLAAEDSERRAPLELWVQQWEALTPEVGQKTGVAEAAIRKSASPFGVEFDDPPPWRGEVDINADPDRMAEEAFRTLENARTEAARAGGGFGASLARSGQLYAFQILLVVVGAVGVAVLLHLGAGPDYVGPILGGVGLGVFLLWVASRPARRNCTARLRELYAITRRTVQRFESHADLALKNLDKLHIALAEEHAGKVANVESRIEEEIRERSAPIRERLEVLRQRKSLGEKRMFSRYEFRLEALGMEEMEARRRLQQEHDDRVKELTDDRAGRLEKIEVEHQAVVKELDERQRLLIDAFARYADAVREAGERPTWGEIDPARLTLPVTFPRHTPFGRIRVDLKSAETAFDLPVTLSFPEHGSLLVQHGPGEREQAIEILLNTVLRVLTTFPPGKARLTILDPVGLGQSFSALMHLADHDEALVNGRIWTEIPHIEQRLADLTGHIEKIIQKYLRNRYNTIGEYNVEAGELQEPYHFLVVADFPTAMSEIAAERLSSIVSSGPRCGVYTLIAHDTRLDVVPPLDLKRLEQNGPILRVEKDRFRLDGKGFDRAEFVPERPPESGPASALLDSVGQLSVDADRVEVPFAAVTPTEAEVWTDDTTTGVRVAIGRTGAERLQYLDIGHGTAQHALLAGRTGSGKSTLFHVMITNMALWFSPDEVEFYLIDFKKGVEFKPFASYGLPHARVVAIESDREFGLSVLKAVDQELARRGDLFRHLEVQDLAGYRRAEGGGSMPRSLLMIDEFQEFFTEDDVVARDAALLLDRFVRQGRAFGIHVVLGSQTLSGIYTLAKGTLGQMGVRISLQCNESDSYLILSEDNGVARLLSRPGEAIYNDKSGLIEGNNPFQVVWLPENEKAVNLGRVAERFANTPELTRRERVVFEGNMPADLEKNEELAALVDAGIPEGDRIEDDRVWLGEPNAIKGPTKVRFMPASGSNMLIVGQRRDSAFALMTSAMLSLSAQHRPADLRIVILDGGGHEPEYAEYFENLLSAVPCGVERYDLRTVPDVVGELADLLAGGEDREGDRPAVYVFAFGLQRLRMLRRTDEFSMPFGDDAPVSTGEQFSTLLTEGPPQNVHTVIWCDTLMNLTRTLDRRAVREFDMRVLFQMSAADSSELIDSTAANQLGLSSALLALESQGTFEKFRPYAIPELEVMLRFGRRRESGQNHLNSTGAEGVRTKPPQLDGRASECTTGQPS